MRSLKNYVLELKSDLRKYREDGHRFLCNNKEALRSDPIALAAHFDADGQRFVQIEDAAAKGFAAVLDEADRAVVTAWMNENMDLVAVHFEGIPVREGKVPSEQVIARECIEQ